MLSTPTHSHPLNPRRLKPFGSLFFASDKHQKSKASPLGRRYIFVGLEEGAHAVRIWDKQTNRILVTSNASHREDIFPGFNENQSPKEIFSDLLLADDISPIVSINSPPSPSVSLPTVDGLVSGSQLPQLGHAFL